MSNPTANPLGAGGDVTKAAPLIRAYLDKQEPAKASQPAEPSAPATANQPPTAEPKERTRDPETKRFVKSEPQTANEDNAPKAEGVDADEAAAPEQKGKAEATDDQEELADTVEGLAQQLGMDPSELLEHLKVEVKVNGESKRVNLKEASKGYQLESDYRTKTAASAEQLRAAEAIRQEYTQQREHLSSQLAPLVQQMEHVVTADDARLQQLLNDGDILEYERLKFAADQRKSQLNTAKQEQQRLDGERQRESQVRLEQHVAENERILLEKRPDWAKDPDKGRKDLSEIRAYLKSEGVAAEMADKLYEAVPLLMADKARKWDQLQKEKMGRLNEVKTVPKFQKPGPSKSVDDPKKQVHARNLNRLRRSGNVRDAANALVTGGFVTRLT